MTSDPRADAGGAQARSRGSKDEYTTCHVSLTGALVEHVDSLLATISALDNMHRLRIIAALSGGREYVSELSRRLGMSRPLLYMHLQKLEDAGIVHGSLELGEDGKAIKWFALCDFRLELSPASIAKAVGAPTKME